MTYPEHISNIGTHVLEPLRRVLSYRLSSELRGHLVTDVQLRESIADQITADVVYQVHADHLPPAEITHQVRLEVDDPRHASWWDMFKDTYAQRWWMRWRSWPVSYVQTKVSVRRAVVVKVRGHWTYPKARILPEWVGNPVVVATWDSRDLPW